MRIMAALCAIAICAGADAIAPWNPTAADERTLVAKVVTDDPDIPGLLPRSQRPEKMRHLRNDVYAAVTNKDLVWIDVAPDYMQQINAMIPNPTSKALIGHTGGNNVHILWYDAVGAVRVTRPFEDTAQTERGGMSPEDLERFRKERLRRVRLFGTILTR